MSDIMIDKLALENAVLRIDYSTEQYAYYAENIWARDTGVGNPVGRTNLRVMLESVIGEAILDARAQRLVGTGICDRLTSIDDSFVELDVSLGKGWDDDYVADLA
ncbi:MAG: hypothetical protein ACOH19_14125 [Rhodoglobus sp.]